MPVIPQPALYSAAVMPSSDSLYQYPPLVQNMRHANGSHHEHERETLSNRQRNGGIYDGSLSPVTIKDFQDQHRGPPRRPSTPNLDRSSSRIKTGPLPPIPNSHPQFKHHPPRKE